MDCFPIVLLRWLFVIEIGWITTLNHAIKIWGTDENVRRIEKAEVQVMISRFNSLLPFPSATGNCAPTTGIGTKWTRYTVWQKLKIVVVLALCEMHVDSSVRCLHLIKTNEINRTCRNAKAPQGQMHCHQNFPNKLQPASQNHNETKTKSSAIKLCFNGCGRDRIAVTRRLFGDRKSVV